MPASNVAVCLQMAQDGLGIACLPVAMLGTALGAERLRRLDYGWAPDDLRFAARYLVDPAPTYMRVALEIARRLSPPDDMIS